MIDIGQGDSSLINVNDTTTLIDTGGFVMYSDNEYTYSLSKNKILPYLKSVGIKKIDNLVLTHGDEDHMKEALYIIEKIPVKHVYINSNKVNLLEQELINSTKSKKIQLTKLKENEKIFLNKYELLSLNKDRKDENDSSIVLLFNYNNYKYLFMGDASKKIELDLMNKYDLTDIYLLKMGHHGSNTSSDIKFLKKTNPKYSIISVSKNNRFNHPSKETISSLKELNLKYYETSKVGSIKINLKTRTLETFNP